MEPSPQPMKDAFKMLMAPPKRKAPKRILIRLFDDNHGSVKHRDIITCDITKWENTLLDIQALGGRFDTVTGPDHPPQGGEILATLIGLKYDASATSDEWAKGDPLDDAPECDPELDDDTAARLAKERDERENLYDWRLITRTDYTSITRDEVTRWHKGAEQYLHSIYAHRHWLSSEMNARLKDLRVNGAITLQRNERIDLLVDIVIKFGI